MEKIELSEKEIRVINHQLSGNFDRFLAPEEDKQTLTDVVNKATALLRELNAYEEMGDDLIDWYWNKYKKQEGIIE